MSGTAPILSLEKALLRQLITERLLMARKRVTIKLLPQICSKFGQSEWAEVSTEVLSVPLDGTLKAIRERIRTHCPQLPGVYGMVNEAGHVVYVGMSTSLQKRLLTYFSSAGAKKKETRIRRRAVCLVWQTIPHGLIARLRERELIRQFRPELNVQGHPVRMKIGYVIATEQEAESFQLVTKIPKHHAGVWGPLPFNKLTTSAVEHLNLHFGLRDCPKQTRMQFREDEQIQSEVPVTCLRAEMKTCLSPCIGGCSRKQYRTAFNRAQTFLSGRSAKIFGEIEQQMLAAAKDRQFERAAKLRDRAKAFHYVSDHLRRFHDWTSQANFVYQVNSKMDEQTLWIIIVRGLIVDVLQRPQTEDEKQATAALINSAQEQFSGSSSTRNISQPGDFEAARILFRWFRKYPAEKKQQLTLKKALKHCTSLKKQAS